jgi:dolichol-phosphate mannosyltransferase
VYNEQSNLVALYQQVGAALASVETNYELVFVDNGSFDNSLDIIKQLAQTDPRVRYVSLSRNFGYQGGIFAGLSYARGEAVVTMAADLQHPPGLLPEMVRLWRQEFEVVYTTKRNYHLTGWRYYQVRLFYWFISKISGLKLSFGQSDFRLLDRKVVDTILGIQEYRKFLRGMVNWVGFRQAGLEYEVAERFSGESKFSFRSLMSLALDGILAFSSLPLRWILVAGLVLATLSFFYTMFALVLGVMNFFGFWDVAPPGWATLAVAITFLGGTQLIAVGVLGEYIGRIYEQIKGRPVFIVRETSEQERVAVRNQVGSFETQGVDALVKRET